MKQLVQTIANNTILCAWVCLCMARLVNALVRRSERFSTTDKERERERGKKSERRNRETSGKPVENPWHTYRSHSHVNSLRSMLGWKPLLQLYRCQFQLWPSWNDQRTEHTLPTTNTFSHAYKYIRPHSHKGHFEISLEKTLPRCRT